MPELIIRDQYFGSIIGWVKEEYIPQKFFQRAQSAQRMAIQQSSCAAAAFAVSDLLASYGLVSKSHTDFRSLRSDLTRHGWFPIKNNRYGALVLWETVHGHHHIGFDIGCEHALSFHPDFREPQLHHITFGLKPAVHGRRKEKLIPYRAVTQILWHPKLDPPRA